MRHKYQIRRHYDLDLDPSWIQGAITAFTDITAYFDEKSRSARGYPEKIGSSWRGRTATAVKEEMLGWSEVMATGHLRLAAAVSALQKFKNDLEDLATDLNTLNNTYDDLKLEYSNTSIQSNEPYSRLSGKSAEDTWAADQRRCDQRFEGLRERAEDSARALARVLDEAVLVPIPSNLRSTSCLGPSGEQQVFDSAYAALSGPMGLAAARFGAGYGSELTPAEAQTKAIEWADRLEQLQSSPEKVLSPEQISTFSRYAKDPRFAAELVRIVGLEKFVALTEGIARQPKDRDLAHRGVEYPGKEDYDQARANLVRALAVTLGTASHEPGFPADAASQLVDLAKRGHGAAVDILLRLGGPYAKAFSVDIAEQMYAAEQQELGGPPDHPVRSQVIVDSIRQGDIHLTGIGDFGDPMAGALAALSGHPREAQLFLLAKDPQQGTSRLRYLVTKHDWATDRGQALGDIVIAAGTIIPQDDTKGSPGADSVAVSEEFLSSLKFVKPKTGASYFDVPIKAKRAIGAIIAVYYEEAMATREWSDASPRAEEARLPVFYGTRERLPQLVQAACGDPEGAALILAGHVLHTQSALLDAADKMKAAKSPDEIADARISWNGALAGQSKMIELISTSIQFVATGEGRKLDLATAEEQEAREQDILTMTAVASGLLPSLPMVGLAAGSGLTVLANVIAEKLAPSAETNYEEMGRQETLHVERSLKSQLQNQAAMVGLSTGIYYQGFTSTPQVPMPRSKELAEFTDASGAVLPWNQMSGKQQQAFIHWAANHPLGDFS